MDTSFLSGPENLHKYKVSIGLIGIVLSLYYLNQKTEELEIERIEIQKEESILLHQTKLLESKIEDLEDQINSSDTTGLIEIKTEFSEDLYQAEVNSIILQANRDKLATKEAHLRFYQWAKWISLAIGSFLLGNGFSGWTRKTNNDDDISDETLRKLKNENKLLERQLDKK